MAKGADQRGKRSDGATTRSLWLAENEVFVRRARDAARQAIFLLDHGRTRGRAWIDGRLDRTRPFMWVQVRAVVHAVSVPAIDRVPPAGAEAGAEGARVVEEGREWPRGITRAAPAQILEQWRTVCALLDNDATPTADQVEAAWVALRRLLDLSRPPTWSVAYPFLPSLRILDHARMTTVRFLSRRIVSMLMLGLAAVVVTKVEAVSNLIRNDYRADGAFLLVTILLSATLWLIPLAGWALTGGLGIRAFWSPRYQALEPERGIARWPKRGGAAHLLSIAFALAGLAVLLWFPLIVFAIAERRRTLFSILSILSAALFGAHILDRWDFLDSRPVRFLALAWAATLLFLVVWSQGTATPNTELALRILAAATFVPAVGYHVRRAWLRRSSVLVAGFMSVLYALIGVGIVLGAITSDAEAWRETPAATAAATEGSPQRAPIVRLCAGQWPYPNSDRATPVVLVAASGGGSRAAYFTARTLELLDRSPARAADDDPAAGNDRASLGDHVQAISSVSGGSLAAAAYIAQRHRRQHPQEGAANQAEPGILSRAPVSQTEEDAGTPTLADAVNRDFLWPTIKGFLVPFVSRGRVLEAAWEQAPVGLGGLDLGALADGWRTPFGNLPPYPMPLFNSCSLDGHDVVISPLPRQLYSSSSGDTWDRLRDHYWSREEQQGGPAGARVLTWVAERDGIYGLEQLLPRFNPSLAQAVRASANFPYGFPLVKLDVPLRNQVLSPRWRPDATGNEAVKLTDGGALSNSGLWSLYRLMTLRPVTVEELRRRGVLLVIVEASRMPEYEERAREVVAIANTVQNKNPMAQYLHREMLARLRRDYGDALEIVQFDVPPAVEMNVFTTWSLDSRSQTTLRTAFDLVAAKEERGLATKWQRLRHRVMDAAVPARDAARACDPPTADTPPPGGRAAPPSEIFDLRPPLD